MVGIPTFRRNEMKSLKLRMRSSIITIIIMIILLLVIYIVIDLEVNREYTIVDSKSQIDSTYRIQFNKLISNIENGNMTGIPTIDDAGVSYGTRIDIIKGKGDFFNIKPEYSTSVKTYTWYNYWGNKKAAWSTTSNQYTYAYSKLLHQNYTVYERSGVVKLFDRYNLVALGTYWADKLQLPSNQGATYRVYMDNGKTYDIICFDVASAGDKNSMNSTNGKSLGHIYGSNVCITEFDLLNLNNNFPILPSADSKHPEMRYNELVKMKNDPGHVQVTGSLNVIPEFEGNVIALQLIEDPKVKKLLAEAQEEVKQYKK